jgi:hypothetical protein
MGINTLFWNHPYHPCSLLSDVELVVLLEDAHEDTILALAAICTVQERSLMKAVYVAQMVDATYRKFSKGLQLPIDNDCCLLHSF